MASFNKVILVGNLTRDPQVRAIASGQSVCELGLAVNRTWFDQKSNSRKEETTFVDVTLWGRQAEIAGEYLSKGRQILIEGRLQLDQWDDKDGQKRSKLRVVCENMTMLGGKGDGAPAGGGGGGGYASGGGGGGGNYGGGNRGGAGGNRSTAGGGGNRAPEREPSPVDDFYADSGPAFPSGSAADDGGFDDDVPF
jgi:single-strand DNA-binding protein